MVTPRDPDERLDPFAGADKSLLVEDEEGSVEVLVLGDVVPGVDCENALGGGFFRLADPVLDELPFPLEGVSLLGRRDDDDLAGGFFLDVVGRGDSGLTGADPSPEDLAVSKSGKGVLLMGIEICLEQDATSFCRIEIVWRISVLVHSPGSTFFVSVVP